MENRYKVLIADDDAHISELCTWKKRDMKPLRHILVEKP